MIIIIRKNKKEREGKKQQKKKRENKKNNIQRKGKQAKEHTQPKKYYLFPFLLQMNNIVCIPETPLSPSHSLFSFLDHTFHSFIPFIYMYYIYFSVLYTLTLDISHLETFLRIVLSFVLKGTISVQELAKLSESQNFPYSGVPS